MSVPQHNLLLNFCCKLMIAESHHERVGEAALYVLALRYIPVIYSLLVACVNVNRALVPALHPLCIPSELSWNLHSCIPSQAESSLCLGVATCTAASCSHTEAVLAFNAVSVHASREKVHYLSTGWCREPWYSCVLHSLHDSSLRKCTSVYSPLTFGNHQDIWDHKILYWTMLNYQCQNKKDMFQYNVTSLSSLVSCLLFFLLFSSYLSMVSECERMVETVHVVFPFPISEISVPEHPK